MISLVGLALTGGALFGGIEVLRRRQNEGRPLWLRERRLTAVTVAEKTGPGHTAGDVMVDEPALAGAAGLVDYVVYDQRGRRLSIIALTSSTALIHLALGLQGGIPLLVWNGAGYLLLLAGKYAVPQLAPYRQTINDGLMAYTGTTVAAYFLTVGPASLIDPVGLTTKLIEIGLLGLLWQEEGAG